MKRAKVKPRPQQENPDDLGPQPDTLKMCAPGIALLAEGAHVRAPNNCNCLIPQAHV